MAVLDLAQWRRLRLQFSLRQLVLFIILLSFGSVLYSNWHPVQRRTNRDLDLAIEGAGYFQVCANGECAYTRHGNFHIDENYQLAFRSPQGEEFSLDPPIAISKDSIVRIDYLGVVHAAHRDYPHLNQICGQIQVTRFDDDVKFQEVAPGVVQPVPKESNRTASTPGTNGTGWIRHRTLEYPAGIREAWPFLAGAAMATTIAYLLCEVFKLRNQVSRLKAK